MADVAARERERHKKELEERQEREKLAEFANKKQVLEESLDKIGKLR